MPARSAAPPCMETAQAIGVYSLNPGLSLIMSAKVWDKFYITFSNSMIPLVGITSKRMHVRNESVIPLGDSSQ